MNFETALSADTRRNIEKWRVRSVPCPTCNAPAFTKCIGARGQARTACHQARWDKYKAGK